MQFWSSLRFSPSQNEAFQLEKDKLTYKFPKIGKSLYGNRNLEDRRGFGWERAFNLDYRDFGPKRVKSSAGEA